MILARNIPSGSYNFFFFSFELWAVRTVENSGVTFYLSPHTGASGTE